MAYYPESNYSFGENEIHSDGSVTVHCSLTVEGMTRSMWLPVMDSRNKSIQNPTSRDISDAKMRALTKAICMHGLGHSIYAGEDLPRSESVGEDDIKILVGLIEQTKTDLGRLLTHFKVNSLADMDLAQFKQAVTLLESKLK